MNPAAMAKVQAKISKASTLKNAAKKQGHTEAPTNCHKEAMEMAHYLTNRQEKLFVKNFAKNSEMDISHYLNLWAGIRRLAPRDKKAMCKIIGMEIDMQNIMWTYRLKKYYKVYGKSAFGYLIPIRYRLGAGELEQMAAVADVYTMEKLLADTIYGAVITNLQIGEKLMAKRIADMYRIEGRGSHIAAICGYLHRLRM